MKSDENKTEDYILKNFSENANIEKQGKIGKITCFSILEVMNEKIHHNTTYIKQRKMAIFYRNMKKMKTKIIL